MNVVKQLLRQPLRTIAACLALSAASVFLCLSFGVFQSARATADRIEENFVTLALPTSETERVEVDTGNGLTMFFERSVITGEQWDFIEGLPESSLAVKGAYRQSYSSAYSPAFSTALSAKEPGRYRIQLDAPYTDAAFAVTITDIGETGSFPDGSAILVNVTASIDQTILLHPGYEPRDSLWLRCTFNSQEEMDAAKLEVGGRYLVYGGNYSDDDLELRTSIAEIAGISLKDISWDNVSYDPEDLIELPEGLEGDNEPIVAVYVKGDGEDGSVSMTQNDLDMIGRAGLHVASEDSRFLTALNPTAEFPAEAISVPSIAPLAEEDAQAFLSSQEGEKWLETFEQARTRWQCVPVLGTDYLESMYLFQQRDAFVIDGRAFTLEEYESGAQVCVLPEALALSSGLTVGDRIELSWYDGATEMNLAVQSSNLTAQVYSQAMGFSEDARSFEVIGVYRQSNLWEDFAFAFTPNTVFVPNKSITAPTITGNTGVFYTLVLKNGSVDEVRALLAERGYPEDLLLYFDNGYTEFQGTLKSFQESAVRTLIASILTWLVVLAGYLALFVRRQQRIARLMLSLGANRSNALGFVFSISIIPAAFASILGGVCGSLWLRSVLQRLFSAAGDALADAFSAGSAVFNTQLVEQSLVFVPWYCVFMAAMQLLLYGAVLFVYARRISRTTSLMRLSGAE